MSDTKTDFVEFISLLVPSAELDTSRLREREEALM
jgi:hypothetical protein